MDEWGGHRMGMGEAGMGLIVQESVAAAVVAHGVSDTARHGLVSRPDRCTLLAPLFRKNCKARGGLTGLA